VKGMAGLLGSQQGGGRARCRPRRKEGWWPIEAGASLKESSEGSRKERKSQSKKTRFERQLYSYHVYFKEEEGAPSKKGNRVVLVRKKKGEIEKKGGERVN